MKFLNLFGFSFFLQGNSDFASTIAPTHASLSIDHEPVSTACGLQPCSNSQQESKQDAGLAVVTIENLGSTTKEQGSPSSLEERTQGEDSAVVTHTSCTSGSLCQSQETVGAQKGTPAANSPAGRNRKNKKRTTKTTTHASKSPRNNRSTPEDDKGTACRQTTGSRTEAHGAVPPREPAVASVIGDGEATKTLCSLGTDETASPIKPASAPGGDGQCAGTGTVALPTTIIVEKQEGEKWEVDLLICERVVETESVTETEQRDTESLPAEEAKFNLAVESAAERTGKFITVLNGNEKNFFRF